MAKQKSIPLEALDLLCENKPLTVCEVLAAALGPDGKPKGDAPVASPGHASHIVDITDQFVGKTFMITGAKKPQK